MRELSTEIHISAPIEQVWQVLTDFNEWGNWNPTVNKASGDASVGSTLTITMSGDEGKDGPSYKPRVMEAAGPRSFRWRATMMGGVMFKNDRVFELTEKDGGTQLVHTEAFSGLMAAMSWKKLSGFVPAILERMNEALKEKLEGKQALDAA